MPRSRCGYRAGGSLAGAFPGLPAPPFESACGAYNIAEDLDGIAHASHPGLIGGRPGGHNLGDWYSAARHSYRKTVFPHLSENGEAGGLESRDGDFGHDYLYHGQRLWSVRGGIREPLTRSRPRALDRYPRLRDFYDLTENLVFDYIDFLCRSAENRDDKKGPRADSLLWKFDKRPVG